MGELFEGRNSLVKPDEKDAALLAEREAAWVARTGPRVGDFVRVKGDLLRFTYDTGRGLQTTVRGRDSSFFLTRCGRGDFSGSLDSPIPHDKLVDTGETMPGHFWFFHHDEMMAHNGVNCEIPCRVYAVSE